MKKVIIAIVSAALVAVIFSVIITCYGRIMTGMFASANNLDISYAKLRTQGFKTFSFVGLKAIEKKSGIGMVAGSAQIILDFKHAGIRNPAAAFVLKDVRFVKKSGEKAVSYNNIDGLVALPFSSLWTYKDISGHVSPVDNGFRISDFMATGEEIKFSFNGLLTRSNTIDADVGIYFQSKIIGNISPELSSMILADSDKGWKELSVKLVGDLSKPSIQVTGKLFRLNIGVKP